MGGDRVHIEPNSCEQLSSDAIVWHIFSKGRVSPFLECLKEHEKSCPFSSTTPRTRGKLNLAELFLRLMKM